MISHKRPSHRTAFVCFLGVALTLFLLGTRTVPAQTSSDVPAMAVSEEPVAVPEAPPTAPVLTMEAAAPVPAPSSPPTGPVVVEKKDNWWQTTLGGLIQLLLLLVAGIATAVGVPLLAWLTKKAKITNSDQVLALERLYGLAVNIGIDFATQQANKLNNSPDAKSQRIKWATDKAAEMIKEWGLPEKAGKWIADRIEAHLGAANGTKPTAEPPKEEKTPVTAPSEEKKPE